MRVTGVALLVARLATEPEAVSASLLGLLALLTLLGLPTLWGLLALLSLRGLLVLLALAAVWTLLALLALWWLLALLHALPRDVRPIMSRLAAVPETRLGHPRLARRGPSPSADRDEDLFALHALFDVLFNLLGRSSLVAALSGPPRLVVPSSPPRLVGSLLAVGVFASPVLVTLFSSSLTESVVRHGISPPESRAPSPLSVLATSVWSYGETLL